MDKTRLWIIGSVLAMVIVAALGWVVGVQPQLDAVSAASAQVEQASGTNVANSAVLARLRKDSENLPAVKEKIAQLGQSVPAVADIPRFAEELNGFAAAHGVTITTWQISDAQAFAPPTATVTGSGASASGSSGSSTSTPTPAPTPEPTATPTPTVIPGMPPVANPLVNAQNFTVVPVSFTINGAYPNILSFVEAAQKGDRLFLVNGLDINTAASGAGFDGKVGGYIYVLATTSTKKASTPTPSK